MNGIKLRFSLSQFAKANALIINLVNTSTLTVRCFSDILFEDIDISRGYLQKKAGEVFRNLIIYSSIKKYSYKKKKQFMTSWEVCKCSNRVMCLKTISNLYEELLSSIRNAPVTIHVLCHVEAVLLVHDIKREVIGDTVTSAVLRLPKYERH